MSTHNVCFGREKRKIITIYINTAFKYKYYVYPTHCSLVASSVNFGQVHFQAGSFWKKFILIPSEFYINAKSEGADQILHYIIWNLFWVYTVCQMYPQGFSHQWVKLLMSLYYTKKIIMTSFITSLSHTKLHQHDIIND